MTNIKLIILIPLLMIYIITPAVFAQSQSDNDQVEDLLDMSLEGLMEIPVVVTASRHAHKINQSSIPISIITAEDIHYSGLTSISDIIRFAPGMDAIPNRRGFTVAAVRGFHDNLSERTLVLINGRPINNPYSGAADFFRFPINTEDIERIEILRGPGGAAWGANAFTGVINVITKDPLDISEVTYTSTFTHFNDTINNLNYNFGTDKVRNRFSLSYTDLVSSHEANSGDVIFRNPALYMLLDPDDYAEKDFFRQYAMFFQSDVILSDTHTMDYSIGYSNTEAGNVEFLGIASEKDFYVKSLYSHMKFDKIIDIETSAYIQFRYDFYEMFNMPAANFKSHNFDIEAQYSFPLMEDHYTQLGGNFHVSNMALSFPGPTQTKFQESNFNQYQIGLFAIDRWDYDDNWTFESQLRGDYFSENQNEIAARMTALRYLDNDKNRALRFSGGRAYRTPMIFLRGSSQGAIPIAPGIYYTNLVEAQDLQNEKIFFLEAGYQQSVIDNTMFNINGYYQQMDDMIGLRTLEDPLGLNRRFTQFFNQGTIDAYGSEVDIERKFKNSKLKLWYAYNDIQNKFSNQDFRAYSPAIHKSGLTWRYFINDSWTFNTNYQYTAKSLSYSDIPDIKPNHRLDLTLSRKVDTNGEFTFGVIDLINSENDPMLGFGQFTANKTPGRMFFARLQLKF